MKKIKKSSESQLLNNTHKNIYIFIGISVFLMILGTVFFRVGSQTRNADIATYDLSSQHISTEKEYKEAWKSIKQSPQLESNMMQAFYHLGPQEQAEIIAIGEKYNYTSSSYYIAKLQYLMQKQENPQKIQETFFLAKHSVGNSIDPNIQLFKIAKLQNILSKEELKKYSLEILSMVPERYTNFENFLDPEVKKFWKNHPEYNEFVNYLE